jgi:molybdenum cofactor cytidylyltransferase
MAPGSTALTDPAGSLGAVLLAAGSSSRLGEPKQLLQSTRWEGEALVARQARLLLDLGFACVVVVTGAEQCRVEQALDGLDVVFVHNDRWRSGMGSSIACGMKAMPERVRGALLLQCDQWAVDRSDLDSLLAEWADHPASAVVSKWTGNSGPPVIFPRVLFDPLSRLSGDRGGKKVLKRFTGEVRQVHIENASVDIDIPEDIPKNISGV